MTVFLRKLEYYQGILILATNMIHTIDESFRSRISIAHEYYPLDVNARMEVWTHIIEGMSDIKADKRELRTKISRWAKEDLNARQIRNILMTAETATFDGLDLLRADTVEVYIRQSLEFGNLFKRKADTSRRRILD
jgi:hypothetical protein